MALLSLLLAATLAAAAGTEPRPNVVLILADDLGSGELSSYGGSAFATPAIDAIGRDGVRLTRFYVAEPICSPSRAAFYTGRAPARYSLGGGALGPEVKGGLPATESTIADLLGARGYQTALIGKWHLGVKPEYRPNRHGFQDFLGMLYGHAQTPLELYRNDALIEAPAPGGESEKLISTLTQRYTGEAVKFLETARRPFFLVFAQAACHSPAVVSPGFRGRTKDSHGDSIVEMDWSVGQVTGALDRLGLSGDTILIFASDNGSPGAAGNGPLRGGKWSALEGGIRVPFLIRWPGRLPAGRVEDRPAIAYDLLPTLAAMTGAALPNVPLDGRDISGLLAGDAQKAEREFLWPRRAFMAGAYKLVIAKGRTALYDVVVDPRESRDLAAEQPAVLARLQAAMAEREADLRPARTQKKPRKGPRS